MHPSSSRRKFLKTATIAGSGLLLKPALPTSFFTAEAELYTVSRHLLTDWTKALLRFQVTDKSNKADYGGIRSPDNQLIPGRSGDAIYPFLHLASATKDHQYMDAAFILYRWMENTVSQPDGSWLNEAQKNSWKGITVFTTIALAESVKHYGHLIEPSFKAEIEQRLKKAADYIVANFSMDYGNINYPITASYALSLTGELLDIKSYKEKGRFFAHQATTFISPKDGFIFGEGTPYHERSAKGCLPVDLGYNVEESLPALVLYGRLTKDEEVLQAVTRSLHTHLSFMLPDGAWDNSWGTRNFKWTYWGSRTSDGCQPAYGLMTDRDPVFYKAALANTKLLQACTRDGLLYGGPHYISHGIQPNIHHTLCHSKALTTLLIYGNANDSADKSGVLLPREKSGSAQFFGDIQTWLIAKGKYRATITGYDREYKDTKAGHATGGALTMLWHEAAGPLLAGSMNEYQLFEAGNMPVDPDPLSMPLTPRIELKIAEELYMNIADLTADIKLEETPGQYIVKTQSKLVDKNQQSPPSGDIHCKVFYYFTDKKVTITIHFDDNPHNEAVKIIIPFISKSTETLRRISDQVIEIKKEFSIVRISSNRPLVQSLSANGRVFNFVPGLEAIPLSIVHNDATIELEVTG